MKQSPSPTPVKGEHSKSSPISVSSKDSRAAQPVGGTPLSGESKASKSPTPMKAEQNPTPMKAEQTPTPMKQSRSSSRSARGKSVKSEQSSGASGLVEPSPSSSQSSLATPQGGVPRGRRSPQTPSDQPTPASAGAKSSGAKSTRRTRGLH